MDQIREQFINFKQQYLSGEFLSKNKLSLSLTLVGLVLILGGLFSSNLISPNKVKKTAEFPKQSLVQSIQSDLKVDISGAVTNPAVYTMHPDDRVEDAIKAAGGFADNANTDAISKSVNLSQKLSDGQKIYIPFRGEAVVLGTSAQGVVGINSASLSDLDNLPGIGQVTAQKIIDNRPYGDIDELVNKKIVSKSVFSKIKDLISLN